MSYHSWRSLSEFFYIYILIILHFREMPPKKKKELPQQQKTRGRKPKTPEPRMENSSSSTGPTSPEEVSNLNPKEIIDLEEVITNNGDLLAHQEDQVTLVDSNGPVEVIPSPRKPRELLLDPVPPVVTKDNSRDQKVEQPNQSLSDNQHKPPKATEIQEDAVTEEEGFSDDGGTEIIEAKIEETISHQTERLYDLIEDLERLNQSRWSECKNIQEGIAKLKFLKERANRIKNNSIDLVDFQTRKTWRNEPRFGYINRILKGWERVRERMAAGQIYVYDLPISQNKRPESVVGKTSSLVTIASEQQKKNDLKRLALEERV